MGTPVPKQFWPIRDKPLLYYTLETFECIPWLSQIVVPASPDRLEWLEAQKEAWNLRKVVFVPGGDTRHRSIFEGVKFLASSGLWKFIFNFGLLSAQLVFPAPNTFSL
jgi:2-C-methyl-D-erythritol 4-phosphate cytidylyltransferase